VTAIIKPGSIDDVSVHLLRKSMQPGSLVLIYGEAASGKSALARWFKSQATNIHVEDDETGDFRAQMEGSVGIKTYGFHPGETFIIHGYAARYLSMERALLGLVRQMREEAKVGVVTLRTTLPSGNPPRTLDNEVPLIAVQLSTLAICLTQTRGEGRRARVRKCRSAEAFEFGFDIQRG
jgi:hypothetical protein